MQVNWPARVVALAVLISVATATALAIATPPGRDRHGPARDRLSRAELAARAAALGRRLSVQEAAAGRARPAAMPRFPVLGKAGYGEHDARFGVPRAGHIHQGQDVFAKTGTPLLAVADSVVVDAGDGGGRGNFVELFDRSRRLTFVYFHMNKPPLVHKGQRVARGRRVGEVGCTGSCWGAHLHFEIHRGRGSKGRAIDPLRLLRQWQRARRQRPARAPAAVR